MPGFYLGTLAKNMHARLIGDSKLTLGLTVSEHGCLSYLPLNGPDLQPIQILPNLSLNGSWYRLHFSFFLSCVIYAVENVENAYAVFFFLFFENICRFDAPLSFAGTSITTLKLWTQKN